jgi:RND family efflux transporter MFP subunit
MMWLGSNQHARLGASASAARARCRRGVLAVGLIALLPMPAQAQTPDQGAQSLISLGADEQQAFGIALAAPEPAGGSLSRRYPGRVAVPNRQLRVVAAPQAGVVESLLVAEGERVAPGQVLARLASPELVGTQSDYLEAVTRLELADSELEREQMLYREGITAERRLIEARARRRELATLVDQSRQRLMLAGLQPAAIDELATSHRLTSMLEVRTPIGGVVLEQMVSTGQSVAASAPLYRVGELSPLWVEVHVPVEALQGIEVGGPVRLPELGADGRIITVGRLVHEEDQGVLVRAEITKGTERLRPGQFTPAQFTTEEPRADTATQAWRLPSVAVVRQAGGTYCFVAAEGGFRPVPVTVLAEEDQSTVLRGALAASDRVAVGGVAALKAAWLAADGG